jgi:hypothetical protein
MEFQWYKHGFHHERSWFYHVLLAKTGISPVKMILSAKIGIFTTSLGNVGH